MTPPQPVSRADFDPDLWCLFDRYVHGDIDRRAFLDRAARFATASGTTAEVHIRHNHIFVVFCHAA